MVSFSARQVLENDSMAYTEVRPGTLRSIKEAEVEAVGELRTNLRQMVNNPDFSDLVFVCNDGERVRASRILLVGRSAWFKSMLINGMEESSLSIIEMPEVSSPVLLSVLEFLYTGSLSDYHPRSWRMGCEIKVASRFFLLPRLDMITNKFMLDHITGFARDLPAIASLLTEAMGFKALCDEPDVSLKELVTILSSNWSESGHISKLSEDAFRYLLANTSGKSEDCYGISFREYLRFKQVIRWWICQNDHGSGGAEELVNFIALDEEEALSIHRSLENIDIIENDEENTPSLSNECSLQLDEASRLSNEWNSLQLDEASRNSLARLVSNIDCRMIHPVLLAEVVEPLNIFSSAEILSAFRFHAIRGRKIGQTREFVWMNHGDLESHSIAERGRVVEKLHSGTGIAVMIAAMSPSYGLYQWRCIVEEMPETFCELGFTCSSDLALKKTAKRLSDLKCARVVNISVLTGVDINWPAGAGGRIDWRYLGQSLDTGSTVQFKFDAYRHTCSLILDGENFGIVWTDLPNAVCYPAVSFGESNYGRVRIELVSGFDDL